MCWPRACLRTVNYCHYSHISHAYWKKHTHGSCFIYLFFILGVYAMPWLPIFLFIEFHVSSSASVEFMADNGMLYDLETEVNPSLSGLCIFQKKCFSWQEKSPKAGDGLCRSFFQCLCFPPNVFLDYIFYIFWGIYMVSAFSWKIDFKQLFNIAFLISMYIIYMLTKNYKRPNHAQKTIRQNLYKYMPCTHPLQKLAQQRSWSWSQESHII